MGVRGEAAERGAQRAGAGAGAARQGLCPQAVCGLKGQNPVALSGQRGPRQAVCAGATS